MSHQRVSFFLIFSKNINTYTITTPISTSAEIIEGKDASILEELSRKYSTGQLIEYLKRQEKVYETDHAEGGKRKNTDSTDTRATKKEKKA